MNYQKSYYPKRPVKSFQDLEVYQKLLAVSVAIAKRIKRPAAGVVPEIVSMALDLPLKIAAAHSLRFGGQTRAIEALEEVMLNCNLLVVYLEQYRDIENPSTGSGQVKIEAEFFEEQIKNLLTVRMKILHLQRSWQKFTPFRGRGRVPRPASNGVNFCHDLCKCRIFILVDKRFLICSSKNSGSIVLPALPAGRFSISRYCSR